VKKTVFLTAMILVLGANLFAQEKKMSVAAGLEWNMNSRVNFAGAVVIGFDYSLPHSLAVGATITASNNFSGFTVIEPAAMFRWYFLRLWNGGFFAQADMGCYLFIEGGKTSPMFEGGLRGGFRLPLGSSFHVEPYGRIGYPFAFGFGALAGYKF